MGYLGVGYLGGTDGTLGPMGPWDRWDLGLKDPGPQGPPIIKLHIDYIMKLFIDTRPGPARPGPAVVNYREEGAGATDEREVRLVSNPGGDPLDPSLKDYHWLIGP